MRTASRPRPSLGLLVLLDRIACDLAPGPYVAKLYARICGVLYLYIIAAGTFAELVVGWRLVVSADAAATAINIMANESLFRIGFSGELMQIPCDVAVAMILYALLRPVVFFGFACLSLGYLIFRSRFLPRTIGALLAIAGACYLVNSFAHFLDPAFVRHTVPRTLRADPRGGALAHPVADREGRGCCEVGRESERPGELAEHETLID